MSRCYGSSGEGLQACREQRWWYTPTLGRWSSPWNTFELRMGNWVSCVFMNGVGGEQIGGCRRAQMYGRVWWERRGDGGGLSPRKFGLYAHRVVGGRGRQVHALHCVSEKGSKRCRRDLMQWCQGSNCRSLSLLQPRAAEPQAGAGAVRLLFPLRHYAVQLALNSLYNPERTHTHR